VPSRLLHPGQKWADADSAKENINKKLRKRHDAVSRRVNCDVKTFSRRITHSLSDRPNSEPQRGRKNFKLKDAFNSHFSHRC
jgi:hypothetical protein